MLGLALMRSPHTDKLHSPFFHDSNHNFNTIILKGVSVYMEPSDLFRDIPNRPLYLKIIVHLYSTFTIHVLL